MSATVFLLFVIGDKHKHTKNKPYVYGDKQLSQLQHPLNLCIPVLAIEGLKGDNLIEEAACNSMVYMIEDARGPDLFLSRFLLLTQSMDEETRLAKAKEYTEGPLAKLSTYLESHITGTKWLLSKVLRFRQIMFLEHANVRETTSSYIYCVFNMCAAAKKYRQFL